MSDTPNIDWGIAVAELANAVGASFRHNQEDGFIEWTNGTAPTDAEINAEIIRLQAVYDAQAYARNRQYPSIGDQMDMQYHDLLNSTTTWKDAIAKVKADNPKE